MRSRPTWRSVESSAAGSIGAAANCRGALDNEVSDLSQSRGKGVISGQQGTMVYWRMKAGAHAAVHQHPQEQFVWVIKGAISLRIGTEERTTKPGDVAVIPGGVEHEAFFPEDTDRLLRPGA